MRGPVHSSDPVRVGAPRIRSPGSRPFRSPVRTGLELELVAHRSNVTLVSGKPSQWNDTSGNARHAAQSASGSRFTFSDTAGPNNRPACVGSNAAGTHMVIDPFALADPCTIFVVYKRSAVVRQEYLVDGTGAVNRKIAYTALNTSLNLYWDPPGLGPFITGLVAADPHWGLGRSNDGTNSSLSVDGGAANTQVTISNTTAGLTIGARYTGTLALDGPLCAILIYSGNLGGSETTTVTNALKAYYGFA